MARTLIGTVVSDKMQKTVVVSVERKFRHAKYAKVIVKHKKYKAHTEDNAYKIGDLVEMQEVRPISGDKRFTVIKKLKKTT
ncbi:MAG: 30S ribosomal protein S17 [Candidatus Roizmanbacteria bacterium]|nr:30S ribosomal protein S17 [Candidatus Roizmanbacteria bacterium]